MFTTAFNQTETAMMPGILMRSDELKIIGLIQLKMPYAFSEVFFYEFTTAALMGIIQLKRSYFTSSFGFGHTFGTGLPVTEKEIKMECHSDITDTNTYRTVNWDWDSCS